MHGSLGRGFQVAPCSKAETSLASSKKRKKASVSKEEWKRKGAVVGTVREVGRSLGQSGLELPYPQTKGISMKSGAG